MISSRNNISVERELHYCVYQAEDSRVMDYVERMGEDYYRYFDRDPVLRYSDYAALRAIAGYPPVELKPGSISSTEGLPGKALDRLHQPISLEVPA